MELGLQIVPGVVEVGPGLLHPIAAPFHYPARSAIKGRVALGALHAATGSLRAGGLLSFIRAVDVNLELQIVLQHVGRIEHPQSNRGSPQPLAPPDRAGPDGNLEGVPILIEDMFGTTVGPDCCPGRREKSRPMSCTLSGPRPEYLRESPR